MVERMVQLIPDDLAAQAAVWGTRLAISMLIFLGFVVAGMVVKRIIHGLAPRTDPQKEEVLTLVGGIARSALLIFGGVTALGTLGVNVSALVAGLGLTGFALGFAFRDALSNVLAGVMILMYRPFHRGDHIMVVGLEGKVVGIDLRYTTLQNENRTFLIPNSILLTNAISLNRLS
jgi:small conductance mechanosensitive channel